MQFMNNTIAPQRWYRLIPVAFITYSLAYLDRANYGFAAAGEMAKDLTHYNSYIFVIRFTFLFRLFLFPDSRCALCCKEKRQETHLLVADIMGCISNGNWYGQ